MIATSSRPAWCGRRASRIGVVGTIALAASSSPRTRTRTLIVQPVGTIGRKAGPSRKKHGAAYTPARRALLHQPWRGCHSPHKSTIARRVIKIGSRSGPSAKKLGVASTRGGAATSEGEHVQTNGCKAVGVPHGWPLVLPTAVLSSTACVVPLSVVAWEAALKRHDGSAQQRPCRHVATLRASPAVGP